MRPAYGVLLELVLLVSLLTLLANISVSYPLSAVVFLVAQGITTILVHCPAHYFVGRLLGVRFSRMRLGRSTLVRALPPSIKSFSSVLIVFSLSVGPESRRNSPSGRLRAMYLSGVVASVTGAFVFPFLSIIRGNLLATLLTSLFAVAYLLSDVLLSPKSGDLMRARAAAGAAGKTPRVQEGDVETGPAVHE